MQPVQDLPVGIDSLVGELQEHPVNANEFFRTFKERQLSLQQLRVFIRQYHYFCFHFVKVLEGLLYYTPIEHIEMRAELAKTLYSELGSGSPERVHILQLERFARSIGLYPRDLEDTEPITEVTMYLEILRRLFLRSSYLRPWEPNWLWKPQQHLSFNTFYLAYSNINALLAEISSFLKCMSQKRKSIVSGWSMLFARLHSPTMTYVK